MASRWGSLAVLVRICVVCIVSGVQAQAQSLSATPMPTGVPPCALTCIIESLPTTTCSPLNSTCICHDQAFSDAVQPCVLRNCTIREALVAKNISVHSCGTETIHPTRDPLDPYKVVLGIVPILFIIARVWIKTVVKVSTWGWDDTCIILGFVLCPLPSLRFEPPLQQCDYLLSQGLSCLNCAVARSTSERIAVPSLIHLQCARIALVPASIESSTMGGKDIWELTPDQITRFLYLFYVSEPAYVFGIGMIKASMIFMYFRLFVDQTTRKVLWASQTFNLTYTASFILVGIFQCQPIQYLWLGWDGRIPGRCVNINAMSISHSAIQIALDVWLTILPIPQVLKLNLAWKKKLGVLLMFMFGIFLTITHCLRLSSLLVYMTSINITAKATMPALYSSMEISIGIIVTCMPAMRHFFLLVLVPPIRARISKISGSRSGPRSGGTTSGPADSGHPFRPGTHDGSGSHKLSSKSLSSKGSCHSRLDADNLPPPPSLIPSHLLHHSGVSGSSASRLQSQVDLLGRGGSGRRRGPILTDEDLMRADDDDLWDADLELEYRRGGGGVGARSDDGLKDECIVECASTRSEREESGGGGAADDDKTPPLPREHGRKVHDGGRGVGDIGLSANR